MIKTSSNENSIVLNCFCGSETTLKSAKSLNIKLIGIDESDLAIEATQNKLENSSSNPLVPKAYYDFLESSTRANNIYLYSCR